MKILIVYGYEPSGHASSARALEAAAAAIEGAEVVRVNVSGEYHPLMGSALARLYLQIVQKSPALWAYLYDNPSVKAASRELSRFYLFLGGRRLKEKLKELRPDIVICTHATPLGFLAAVKGEGGLPCPLVGVLTDFGVHSYWANGHTDLYLASCQETLEALAAGGAPREKIRVTGIPIDPAFAEPLEKAEARRLLGLNPAGPVLLLSGGTRGLGPMAAEAQALLEGLPQARVLAVCGSNQELFDDLRLRASGQERLRAYGELAPAGMRELMSAADIMIGKAGGLTVAECLALGLPMALFDPIPGQEERNAEYLLKHGAAVRVESLQVLAEVVRGMLAPGGMDSIRARAKVLGRPDSARRTLQALLETAAASV